MSKLMIIFVLFMSGALYDPPRVLNQLGPEAAAIGWKIKNCAAATLMATSHARLPVVRMIFPETGLALFGIMRCRETPSARA